MTTSQQLVAAGAEFAGKVADLLNRTIANGVRVSAVLDNGECRLAAGISTAAFQSQLIPLTVNQRPPTAFLDVSHRFTFDDAGLYLTDARSRFALYATADAEPWFRYEYHRAHPDHSEVHLHVHGALDTPTPPGVRPLTKQHLPLGGRRFRLTLEDLIEFLVREKYARARPGWQRAVAEHRSEWNELQLKAAVRRYPDVALEALRTSGHLSN